MSICAKLDFIEQVAKMMDEKIAGIHTCVPAVITAYDAENNTAVVQPVAQYTDKLGRKIDFPEIADVPVVMPSFEGGAIIIPVSRGDECLLIFAEQSLDLWLGDGAYNSIGDALRFALSNAIALVGYTTKAAGDVPQLRAMSSEDKKIRIVGAVEVVGTLTVNGKAVQVDE